MVHFDVSGSSETGGDRNRPGNSKHQRFVKSRRLLERKGYLKNKQNNIQQKHKPCSNGKFQHQHHHQQQRQQQHHQGPKPYQRSGKQAPKVSQSSQTKFTTQQIGASSSSHTKKPTGPAAKPSSSLPQGRTVTTTSENVVLGDGSHSGSPLKYLAIDCEMVGTGPKGKNSELARCSIVTYEGDCIYDKFIKPLNPVTDLRTRWSGIRWQNLRNATPFFEAKREVS